MRYARCVYTCSIVRYVKRNLEQVNMVGSLSVLDGRMRFKVVGLLEARY